MRETDANARDRKNSNVTSLMVAVETANTAIANELCVHEHIDVNARDAAGMKNNNLPFILLVT